MKLKLSILLLICMCLLYGCGNNRNQQVIEDMDFIRTVGIDYIKNNYEISVLLTDADTIIQGSGQSIYEAFEQIKRSNKRKVALSQASYYFVGEEAAEEGVDRVLNFFLNQEATQMNALVYITKSMYAHDFLSESLEEKLMAYDEFDAIAMRQSEWYKKNENTLSKIYQRVLENQEGFVIPYAELSDHEFIIEGDCVFVHNRLADYLTRRQSLGADLVKNRMNAYPIYLDGAGLEASISKTTTALSTYRVSNQSDAGSLPKTQINQPAEGRLHLSITVRFESKITEYTADKLSLQELEKMQQEYVKGLIQEAIDYVKLTGNDIFQMELLIKKQVPELYRSIKNSSRNLPQEEETELSRLLTSMETEIITEGKIIHSFMDFRK